MHTVIKILTYFFSTRRAWWYLASRRNVARYRKTYLGIYWIPLSSTIQVLILSSIYAVVFKVDDFGDYFVSLSLGYTLWQSLAGCVISMQSVFVNNESHIKNHIVRPEFWSYEEWAYQTQNLLLSLLPIIVYISFVDLSLSIRAITLGIAPLFNIVIFMYWVPLLIAIFNMFVINVSPVIPSMLQLIFLVTPILYKSELLGRFAFVASINPVYHLLHQYITIIKGSDFRAIFFLIFSVLNMACFLATIYGISKISKRIPLYI